MPTVCIYVVGWRACYARLIAVLGLALGVLLGGCKDNDAVAVPAASEPGPWSAMPVFSWDVLRDADSLEIAALDPDNFVTPERERLRAPYEGHIVLSRSDVRDADKRRAVAEAVGGAVNEADGTIGKCFSPRYALTAEREGKGKTEMVLSYTCQTMRVDDVGGLRWVGIHSEGRDVLDKIFEAQGLKIAP